jgi:hypothetical protein
MESPPCSRAPGGKRGRKEGNPLRPTWQVWRCSGCTVALPPSPFMDTSSNVQWWKVQLALRYHSSAFWSHLYTRHAQGSGVAKQLKSVNWTPPRLTEHFPQMSYFQSKKSRCMTSCGWNAWPGRDDSVACVVVVWHSQCLHWSPEKVSDHGR